MKTKLIILLFLTTMNAYSSWAQVAGIYVGGHFRRERPKTITNLKASGFSYVILFNINVETNGDLTTDGEMICSNGNYVFGNTQPNYIADVTSLKQGVTSVKRVEQCIGGWGNHSYANIKNLVNSQGTGTGSILYRNFQALKNAIPSIDAINNDDEETYDVNSATAFHVMLADIGFKSTLAPYMNKPYWQQLATNVNNQRPGKVDRIYLQWYDGGAGNNPCDWNINNITMHTGDLNYENSTTVDNKMISAKNNCGSKGGFLWVYNDENINLRQLAGRINTIFGGSSVDRGEVATFYGDCDYGGSAIGLPEGTFTKAQLQAYGITENTISSIQVDPGYVVKVFVNDNFTGTSYTTSVSDNCLVDNGMNDNISSIQISAKGISGLAGTYFIRSRGSKLYMDVEGAAVNDGADLIQWNGSFSDNQQFTFTELGNGIYRINGVKSGKAFDIDDSNPLNAAQLQIWNYSGSYNQQYILIQNAAGYYQLIARHSGLALKVEGSSNNTGAKIKQANNDGSIYTHWILTPVTPKPGPITIASDCNYGGYKVSLGEGIYSLSDLVEKGITDNDISSIQVSEGFVVRVYLDDNQSGNSLLISASDNCLVDNGFNDNITSIIIRPDGATNMEGTYFLQNRNSGLFMDVSGGTTATQDGANIQQWTSTNGDNQKFEFIHLGNGAYEVLAAHSRKAMEVSGGPGVVNDGANVQQWTYLAGSNQQFIVVPTGDGFYKLVARNSGKIVEVAGSSTTAGGNVQIWNNNDQKTGQWNFKPVQLAYNAGDGIRADYFNGQNFDTWKITKKENNVNFTWNSGSPDPSVDLDNFSARWTGKIQPRYTGTYTFYINSDNGRRLWINGQLIIDKWINDWGVEYTGTIALEAGIKYDIVFEYFEATGGASSKLEWSSNSQAREVIPQGQLYSNKAPTVSITTPTNNTNLVAIASTTITATAADADGSIAKVEFYNGTTKLGEDASSPYTYNWTGIAIGTYTITAKAIDNQGVFTNSTAITVKVNANQNPVVAISSPVNNDNFTAPASITINATATDADGTVSKVEFYIGATKLGEDLSSPYTFTWTSVVKGNYTITAKAIDDKNGSTTSTAVVVVVNNPNQAPTVSITTPTNNTTYVANATINLAAIANDADGTVSKVEFYNSTTLIGTSTTTPFSFSWTNVGVGTYIITGKAYDNLGLSASSAPVVVIVNANQTPIITMTASSPSPNTISISTTATDGDGTITKVEFYDGTTKIGESTATPYNFTFMNASAGTHNITAVAIDDKGGKTTSNPIIVTVENQNQRPTISIKSPETNSTFDAPASFSITVDAIDLDGSISKVEFYNNNNKMGEVTTSPFTYICSNISEGTYIITAKAYDNKNEVTTSEPVTIKVATVTDITKSGIANGISIYPVPASSILRINGVENDASLEVINSLGLLVKTGQGSSISTDELQAGFYHIIIRSNGQSTIKAFIKE